MFEARTYEALMEEVLAAAPPGIDTRQGSIFLIPRRPSST